MAKQPFSALRRTAGEVKRYRALVRITLPILGIIALVLAVVYIVSLLYSRYGAFTVTVLQYNSMDYALTLYEGEETVQNDPNNNLGSSYLNMNISEDITNIAGYTLDEINLDDSVGGAHSGTNYAAYTFYCKNAGNATIVYTYQLYIANVKQNLDKAIRIRLYVNGIATTYAYAADGGGAEMDFDSEDAVDAKERTRPTTKFNSETVVTEGTISQFAPQDYTKFTVVIWLEGHDPDCRDDKIGGELKVAMKMSVVGEAAEEE